MTRLTLALTVLVAPLAATSSWGQDKAYWQAAHTWQQTHPVTYYAHTIAFFLAAIVVRRIGRQTVFDPARPLQGRHSRGKRRLAWNRRL